MARRLDPIQTTPGGSGFSAARAQRTISGALPSPPPGPSPKAGNKPKYAIEGLEDRISRLMASPSTSPTKAPLGSIPRASTNTSQTGDSANKESTGAKKRPKRGGTFVCPRCGRSDFPSRPLLNSHARRCTAGIVTSTEKASAPASPSSPKKRVTGMGFGGFGKMGLLSQLRKMEIEDDKRRREEAIRIKQEEEDRKAKEKAEAEQRYKEDQERRKAEVEKEKERILEVARKRKAMEKKQLEFSEKLKAAAKGGDREALNELLGQVDSIGIDAEDPIVLQAKEVQKQLTQIHALRERVAEARRQKEEQEKMEREAAERALKAAEAADLAYKAKAAAKRASEGKKSGGVESDNTDSDNEDENSEDIDEVARRRAEAEAKRLKREQRAEKRAALKRARALRKQRHQEGLNRAAEMGQAAQQRLRAEAEDIATRKRLQGADAMIAREKERIAKLKETIAREKERKEREAEVRRAEEEKREAERKRDEEKRKFEEEKRRADAVMKKKKQDERALQQLIKMQAKGLAAAASTKKKLSTLAKESKQLAEKAQREREQYQKQHEDAVREAEDIKMRLEHEKRVAQELKEDHELELQVRERKLDEARQKEREARKLADRLRSETREKEEMLAKKEARMVFETRAMRERLDELESKEQQSKTAEQKVRDELMKREKELEALRMDQWKEKQKMMDKLRQQEVEAKERLEAVIKEQEIQAKRKEEKAAEEAARKAAQDKTFESLEFQAREADTRARALEDEFKSKEAHLKQREDQLKAAFQKMRSDMDSRLAAAAERQRKEGEAQMAKIEESKAHLREKERALEQKLADQEAKMIAEMEAKMDAEMRIRAEQMEKKFADRMKEREAELKKQEDRIQQLQNEIKEPSSPASKADAKNAELELQEREQRLQSMEASKIEDDKKGARGGAIKNKRKKGPRVFFPEDDDDDDDNIDNMGDEEIDAALARERKKASDEMERNQEQIASLEASMQAKVEAALKEAEEMRELQRVEHDKAIKLAEEIARKKVADLEAKEKMLKDKENTILMEKRKQQEKEKMLSEKEKLMEILQRGREGKMKADYDQKFEELAKKEAELEKKAADAAALDKLQEIAGVQDGSAVDSTAEYGETSEGKTSEHQYSKAEMETYLRGFFECYDYDYSGYITSKDFHAALLSFPDGPSEAVATQLVKSIEEDGYCCYEKFVQNYISEIGLEDEPYDDTTYNYQQQSEAWPAAEGGNHSQEHAWDGHEQYQNQNSDWNDHQESYQSPHGIPCFYCVDSEGIPAVHAAATNGHVECLEKYITGAAVSAAGNLPMQLVGALDSSGRTSIFCACAANQFNCLALLLQTCDEAMESGGARGVKTVQDVLNAQDKRGDTAVHAATVNGFHECLDMLLQSGAESDVPNHKGQEPVHLVHGENCLGVLMDFGADVYAQDSMGRTSIFMAAANGEVEVLRELLDIDEDQLMLDLGDDRGDTPLHAASCNGRHACVKLLLETMADPSKRNEQDLLPGYLAECNGHVMCVELLEKYGGYKRKTDLKEAKAREETKLAEREMKKDQALANDLSKWAEAYDEHGSVYYWNTDTGESRWEAPDGYEEYKQQKGASLAEGGNEKSPIQRTHSQNFASGYGSSYNSPQHGGGNNQAAYGSEYWGAGAEESWIGSGYDKWDATYYNGYTEATEGYDYTAEWEEYWQWYGYEEQEEAPRLVGEADEGNLYEGENSYSEYYHEDTAAAAIAANSAAAAAAIATGPKLNKNYLKMAQNYAAQALYRLPKLLQDLPPEDQGPYCMLCQALPATSVLLPCEHRSVCDSCIEKLSYGITKRKASEATGGAIIKVKPQPCPACQRRCYKVVPIDKFFKLPRDYGPAPKINAAFSKNFLSAAQSLQDGKIPMPAKIKEGDKKRDGPRGRENKHDEGGCGAKVESKEQPPPPLEVEFGPGSIGLELVPRSGASGSEGAEVKSVSGVAQSRKITPKMKLMLVNKVDVSTMLFKDLMGLLSKSGRPITMTFQG